MDNFDSLLQQVVLDPPPVVATFQNVTPGGDLTLDNAYGMAARIGAPARYNSEKTIMGERYIDVTWTDKGLAGDQCEGGYYPRTFLLGKYAPLRIDYEFKNIINNFTKHIRNRRQAATLESGFLGKLVFRLSSSILKVDTLQKLTVTNEKGEDGFIGEFWLEDDTFTWSRRWVEMATGPTIERLIDRFKRLDADEKVIKQNLSSIEEIP